MRSPIAVAKARHAGRRGRKAAPDSPAFDAFISYSHAADTEVARALQSALHRFARPWSQLRALRVFRDEANLAVDPDLWGSIREALLAAKHLILLGSPEAARSEWVGREAATWTERHASGRLLLVLTDGEVAWDRARGDFDWSRTTAVPRRLERAFGDEPRYLDLRWARTASDQSLRNPRFRDAVAELAAPLHGKPKDALIGEDVRQHRRTRRLARTAVAVVCVLAVLASAAAILAVDQRNEAQSQLRLATSRYLAAQAKAVVRHQRAQSLLLSVEALKARDTPEARDALLTALQRTPHLRMLRQPPAGAPVGAAVSPDGQLVAVGTSTGAIYVWEWASGRLRRVLRGHQGRVHEITFGSGANDLVSAGQDGTLRRWNAGTGRAVGPPMVASRDDGVHALALDPVGRRVASGTADGHLQVWDADTGRAVSGPVRASHDITGITFTEGGATLVSAGNDGVIRRWSPLLRRSPDAPLPVTTSSVWGLASAPGGGLVAAGAQDGTVSVLDATGGPLVRTLGRHPGQVTDVAVAPDGRTVASAGFDNAVRLWDVGTGRPVGRPLVGHLAFVDDVAFTPDGRGLVSVGADGVVALWDLGRSSPLARELPVGAEGGSDVALAWSPRGRSLATGTSDGRITLWDGRTGRPSRLAGRRSQVEITSLAYSPGGTTLAVGAATGPELGKTGAVRLWDLRRGRPKPGVLTVSAERQPFWADGLKFNRGGTTLVGGGLGTVMLWRLDARQPGGWVIPGDSTAFSPDGRTLAVTTGLPDDGTVRLWDVPTRRSLGKLGTGRDAYVHDVVFHPNGRTVAAGDNDGTVVLWDIGRQRRIGEPLTGFDARITNVRFSPDGRTLAAASVDDDIRLLDVRTRQPIGAPLTGHAVAFSPDGRWLAAQKWDGDVLLWDLRLATWRRQACALAGRNLAAAEWQHFFGDIRSYAPTCPGLPRGQPATPAVSAD